MNTSSRLEGQDMRDRHITESTGIILFWFAVLAFLIISLFTLSILKRDYHDYIQTIFRAPRSPILILLLANSSYLGLLFLAFFTAGWHKFKKNFINCMKGDEIKKLGKYILVPFRSDFKANRELEKKLLLPRSEWIDRHLLLIPQRDFSHVNLPFKNGWLRLFWSVYGREITPFRVLICLSTLTFACMTFNDYLIKSLMRIRGVMILYLLLDLLMIGVFMLFCFLLGREAIKDKIGGGWRGSASKIGGYILIKFPSEAFTVVCSLSKVSDSLKEDGKATLAEYILFKDSGLEEHEWITLS
jgi:hypothetical protein